VPKFILVAALSPVPLKLAALSTLRLINTPAVNAPLLLLNPAAIANALPVVVIPGAITLGKLYPSLKSVTPDLLMYKNMTGRQGGIFSFNLMPNKTMGNGDIAALQMYQSVQSGNVDKVTDKDGKVLDTETVSAVRALLSSEKNLEEYGVGQYIPQGIDGKKTFRFIFNKPISSESKDEVGGKSLSSITKDTEVNFILKENTGTLLDQLPNNTGYQVYGAMLRGKEIKSDSILEAAGFKYLITPNTTGLDAAPQYVTVDLGYKVRNNKKDPQTGQVNTSVEEKSYLSTINLSGENAKGPDEIVSKLKSLYYENMQENRRVQLEYEKVKVTNGGTVWDPKNALKQAGLSHLIK
jgi:hypothetical protein